MLMCSANQRVRHPLPSLEAEDAPSRTDDFNGVVDGGRRQVFGLGDPHHEGCTPPRASRPGSSLASASRGADGLPLTAAGQFRSVTGFPLGAMSSSLLGAVRHRASPTETRRLRSNDKPSAAAHVNGRGDRRQRGFCPLSLGTRAPRDGPMDATHRPNMPKIVYEGGSGELRRPSFEPLRRVRFLRLNRPRRDRTTPCARGPLASVRSRGGDGTR